MNLGLAALLHPVKKDDFFEKYDADEPFVAHHANDSLGSLRRLEFLTSLQTLLGAWPFPVQAHLPDVRDESSSVEISVKDAEKMYRNGMGLLFNEVERISPLLHGLLEKVRRDLGLSSQTYSRCLVYATPDGKGTAPHFDQNMNFILQIHGTKIWKLAANDHVIHPLTRHVMGAQPAAEMSSYLDDELPVAMPEKSQTIELKPGSLLFVPRGYWHSTEARGEALALNFTFSAPTWIDVFTTALRSRLALSPHWRQTAQGVSDPARRDEAETYFDALLADLKHDLPEWRSADILGAVEPTGPSREPN